MSLAAFLANATVESAYFLVCKESTMLNTNPSTLCPGNSSSTDPTDPARYNSRYCNNCDQAMPQTYSCKGGGGGAAGGICNPKTPDEATVCNTSGCYPITAGHNTCNASHDGVTWNTWDDKTVTSNEACMAEDYKYKYWCPTPTTTNPPPPSGPTTTQPPFDPIKNKCTGGWPVCQISSPFKLPDISTDPCMSDPQADGTFKNPLDNNNPRCSDWNGNKWDQQQDCYFGRGLVQLTWSCNYYKVQSIFTRMSALFTSTGSTDNILSNFISSMDPSNINKPASCNLCANPDTLCGDYSLNGDKIIYSPDQIKQAIPWLACIAYWSFGVNPTWLNCYSFAASFAGIAPSGAGAYPDRLSAYKNLLNIMKVEPKYYVSSSANVCISTNIKANCTDCGGGGGGGGPGAGGGPYKCGVTYSASKDDLCKVNLSCTTNEDCKDLKYPYCVNVTC